MLAGSHHEALLSRLSNAQILDIHECLDTVENNTTRKTAKSRILQTLATRAGKDKFPHLLCTIPHSLHVSKNKVLRFIIAWIHSLNLHPILKRIFASEVKVTEKTGKRITTVLTNHIQRAKEFNNNAPPQCLCHKLSILTHNSANLKSDTQGHMAINAIHLPPEDFGPIQANNKEPLYIEEVPSLLALQNSLDEFLPSMFIFKNISP
jgi:hypothetical protein